MRGLASLVSNPQCTWRRCGLRGIGGGEWVGKIIATASGNCTHPPEPARRGLRGAVLVARGRCRCGGHGARWRRGPERCEILFGGSPMGGGGRRPRAVPTFVRPIGCSNLSQRGESHLPPPILRNIDCFIRPGFVAQCYVATVIARYSDVLLHNFSWMYLHRSCRFFDRGLRGFQMLLEPANQNRPWWRTSARANQTARVEGCGSFVVVVGARFPVHSSWFGVPSPHRATRPRCWPPPWRTAHPHLLGLDGACVCTKTVTSRNATPSRYKGPRLAALLWSVRVALCSPGCAARWPASSPLFFPFPTPHLDSGLF